jgi:hypothetical protein
MATPVWFFTSRSAAHPQALLPRGGDVGISYLDGGTMRELTYSQGVVVDDPVLLATLCVFCDKIWLPYDRVGDAVQDVLTEARPEVAEALRRDPTRNRIAGWEAQYADLFKDRALQRLPGKPRFSSTSQRLHRPLRRGRGWREEANLRATRTAISLYAQ